MLMGKMSRKAGFASGGKNKIKKYFLLLLVAELLMSYTPVFAQERPAYNYSEDAGVSAQIKEFLCAPNEPTDAEKEVGTWENNPDRAAFENTNSSILYSCINRLYRFAIILASVVAVFFIVIAGYVYMGAEGNQEQVEKAKNILTTSIASIVILLAGFVLLRAINPDLVEFNSIQPPSVRQGDLPNWEAVVDSSGKIREIKSPAGTFPALGDNQVNNIVGCGFQAERFRKEMEAIQPSLFTAVVEICKAGSAQGRIDISSVASGKHAPDSYHYKFCAVDFADGSGNFLNTAAGKAAKARAEQFPNLRVNPGVDANAANHMHIDLGNSCLNK